MKIPNFFKKKIKINKENCSHLTAIDPKIITKKLAFLIY